MTGTQPAAGVDHQASPKLQSAGQHAGGVLHQRSKLPFSPSRMALCGFAVVGAIGYITLYSHKKPEATALEAAKVGRPRS